MPVEEQGQSDVEHVEGFREALGASVEAGEIIPDRGIGCLDQVRLRLGLHMRLTHTMTLEGQPVAGIGIRVDVADAADRLLGQAVKGYGAVRALVADMVGDDPSQPAAEGGPDDRPLLFF